MWYVVASKNASSGEAEQQKRAQERAQLLKDIQDEEKKLKQFNKRVESWEHAEGLRRFIAAYAETSRSWSADKQSEYRAWVEWATRQADRMDPLVSERPQSVLDRRSELNWWGNRVW